MNSYRIIPLIALLFCFFITSYSFAQDSEEAIIELDCTIPLEAQHVRPGPKGSRITVRWNSDSAGVLTQRGGWYMRTDIRSYSI